MYKKKGDEIIDKNIRAIESASDKMIEVNYPESWVELPDRPIIKEREEEVPEIVSEYMVKINIKNLNIFIKIYYKK